MKYKNFSEFFTAVGVATQLEQGTYTLPHKDQRAQDRLFMHREQQALELVSVREAEGLLAQASSEAEHKRWAGVLSIRKVRLALAEKKVQTCQGRVQKRMDKLEALKTGVSLADLHPMVLDSVAYLVRKHNSDGVIKNISQGEAHYFGFTRANNGSISKAIGDGVQHGQVHVHLFSQKGIHWTLAEGAGSRFGFLELYSLRNRLRTTA